MPESVELAIAFYKVFYEHLLTPLSVHVYPKM